MTKHRPRTGLAGDATPAAAARRKGPSPTHRYLESSAVLRTRASGRLTPGDERAARRALGTLEWRCTVIAVSDGVLTRAGQAFPVEPVRTLDAVHLATVELLGAARGSLVVVTRDARIRDNAAARGYRTA